VSAAIDAGALTVLRALADGGPSTADRFVTSRGLYVNAWAPHFTRLRKRGLVERTGERETTTHGALAHIVRITDEGLAVLEGGTS
jgi:hypothetical protein